MPNPQGAEGETEGAGPSVEDGLDLAALGVVHRGLPQAAVKARAPAEARVRS